MNIKKKRKSCSPCLDNSEKPLECRDRVFLSLASLLEAEANDKTRVFALRQGK